MDEEKYLSDIPVIRTSIDDITPHKENARIHDDRDLTVLMNNIRQFKFTDANAIQVDGNGVIICGNGRYEAARRLGMKVVPIQIRDDLSEEEIRLKRLSDNMVQDLSLFDEEKKNLELEDLKLIFDIEDFGFEIPDMADIEEDEEEAQEDEEEIEEDEDGGRESFTTMVYCTNEEEYEQLMAFLDETGISGQRCS